MSKKKHINKKVDKTELRLDKQKELISKICCICSALFFSFFVLIVFTDYTNITAVKYNTFLSLTVSLTLVYIIEKGALLLEGYQKNKTRKIYNLPYIFMGVFLGVNCLSAVLSPYSGTLNEKGQSMLFFGDKRYDGLLVIILYIILFLIFSLEKGFGKYFTRIITVVLAITTVIGILQLTGINIFGFYPSYNYYYYKKFISTLGNIDMVSALYCIVLPITAFAYVSEENKLYFKIFRLVTYTFSVFFFWEINVDSGRVAFTVMLLVAFNILFFKREWYTKFLNISTLSVFGIILSNIINFSYDKTIEKLLVSLEFGKENVFYLGIILLIAIFGIVYKYVVTENKLKLAFSIFVILEMLCFAILLYWVLAFADSSRGTAYEFAEILKGRGRDGYGSARYGLWKYTLKMSNERFLIGYGSGTFRTALVEYTSGVSERYSRGIFDFAHNEFLQIYYNCGIFGLLSYMGLMGGLVFKGIKNSLKNNKILILTAALICYFVQSFFMFSIIIVSPLFWIIAGMLCYEIRNIEIS